MKRRLHLGWAFVVGVGCAAVSIAGEWSNYYALLPPRALVIVLVELSVGCGLLLVAMAALGNRLVRPVCEE